MCTADTKKEGRKVYVSSVHNLEEKEWQVLMAFFLPSVNFFNIVA